MKVKDHMNHDAQGCSPHTSILDIACQMRDHHVGTVAVCEDGKLLGVIEERDIVLRVVAGELDPSRTPAMEVMSALVNYCFTTDTLEIAIAMMEEEKISHLLVLDHQLKLVGVASLCELIRHVMHEAGGALPLVDSLEQRLEHGQPQGSTARNGAKHSTIDESPLPL